MGVVKIIVRYKKQGGGKMTDNNTKKENKAEEVKKPDESATEEEVQLVGNEIIFDKDTGAGGFFPGV